MGEKSFGKGSVQTILPTSNGGAVKLTTARYYTPSGRSIQAEGIAPDIELSKVKLEALEKSEFKPLKEADLSNHLVNGKGGKKDGGPGEPGKESAEDLVLNDYPLAEALTLLKGINILR